MHRETKDVKLEELVPFKSSQEQTYENDWIQQLTDCIKKAGLMSPVIARPVDGGKYEVICGNNRVKALEMLGCEIIHADIRSGLSDEEAAVLYYDSRLNQPPFSAYSYSQKFEIVKHCEKFIKENSRQGKRSDLEDRITIKTVKGTKDTCTQLVPGLKDGNRELVPNLRLKESCKSRRPTIRNEAADRLGISKATLDKYMRIIKLPDALLQSIADLLDEKKITFEAAYSISNMTDEDIKSLVRDINKYPNGELDWNRIKNSPKRNAKESDDIIYTKSKESAWRH